MSPGLSTPMGELNLDVSPILQAAQPPQPLAPTTRPSAVDDISATSRDDSSADRDSEEAARTRQNKSQTFEKAADVNPKRAESPEPAESTSRQPQPPSSTSSSDSSSEEAMEKPQDRKAMSPICEGDTTIFHNVLPPQLEAGLFERIRDEVDWQRMMHQGGEVPRLVAVQGEVAADGSQPVYRHPADESPPLRPFTTAVRAVKDEVETLLEHPLNHVLIQLYRGGNDYISEHSDKTLDIARGSFIVNVSLGAERTMIFRTKRVDKDPARNGEVKSGASTPLSVTPAEKAAAGNVTASSSTISGADEAKRRIERAALPHNSLCRMGPKTNMRWLHAIRQDRRMDRDKTEAELAFGGARISLTFRHIATFLDADGTRIWGQGATGKTREQAKPCVNGQTPEAVRLLRAFGAENHASEFDWPAFYGAGFDVLHVNAAPRLFASADAVVNMRVTLMLAWHGISYAKGTMGVAAPEEGVSAANAPPETKDIKFVDCDADRSVVWGEAAILLYLDAVHGSKPSSDAKPVDDEKQSPAATSTANPATNMALAQKYSRFHPGLALLDTWRAATAQREAKREIALLRKELATWDGYAAKSRFLSGGDDMGIVDFAVWPVLHDIVVNGRDGVLTSFSALAKYYARIKGTEAAVKVMEKAT